MGAEGGLGREGTKTGRIGERKISLCGFVWCLKGLIPKLAHGNSLLFTLFP